MDRNFSKIILGTVQLGMPYGLGHLRKKAMSRETAFDILNAAWNQKINTLDTSPEYGVSDKRVADYMRKNPEKNFHIISKIKSIIKNDNLYRNIRDVVRGNPTVHLKNCCSFSLLLHSENDIEHPEVVQVLDELVAHGEISQWGVSIYSHHSAVLAAEVEGCKIVQLPFSFLNQSFERKGLLSMLWKKGKLVHCRSVFTQGLLLRAKLSTTAIDASIERFFSYAASKGVSPANLALSFVTSTAGVASSIIGVDSCSHLQDLCENSLASIGKSEISIINKLANHAILDNVKPETW